MKHAGFATSATEPQPDNVEPARIVVIDDEPVVADVLRSVLGRDGHEIHVAADAASGRALLEHDGPWDVCLVDVMLPDADGLEVLRWVRERQPELDSRQHQPAGLRVAVPDRERVRAQRTPGSTTPRQRTRRASCLRFSLLHMPTTP